MSSIEVEVRDVRDQSLGSFTVSSGTDIGDLLGELDFNLETVVVKRNGKIVTEEEKLESGDEVVIIPVVSGG